MALIKPQQIPMEVKLRLRAILHDGETDEAKAIAAAINAWPGAEVNQRICSRGTEYLILPLLQEPRDE